MCGPEMRVILQCGVLANDVGGIED